MLKIVKYLKKTKILLWIVLCLGLCSTRAYAEEVDYNYTLTDFCCYWSYGYQELHIYDSYFILKNTDYWDAIDTEQMTGKVLVIGEENDEESSSISYTLSTEWDSYKNVIYTGANIPETISFEYIDAEELANQKIVGYDLIIIEYSAEQEIISESLFIQLDQLVKNGQHVVFDTEINDDCAYTGEKNGSVAVIDCRNECLLISSNNKPDYFVNLRMSGTSGYTVTLSSIANVNNTSAMGYREVVKNIKILPTYNSTTLTNTFYKWYDAKKVVLPSFINTIGGDCFNGFSSLQSINLDNVKVIENNAFTNGGFTEVKIPDGVQNIGARAFYLNNLNEVEIASSVSSVGELAFGSDFILEMLSVHVNENGLTLGAQALCVDEDTELCIDYEGETSGKPQLFSPFEDRNIAMTAENFSSLIEKGFVLSFSGVQEDVEEYTLTLVDNKSPTTTYTRRIINGNQWGKYFPEVSDQVYSEFKLKFKGWVFEDGTIINENDIVNVDEDLTIYSLYERDAETCTYTVNFPEYNKTIEVHYGDTLAQYDIPNPRQDGDTFLGWTQYYPVKNEGEDVLTSNSRWWLTSNETIYLYGVWESDVEKLDTAETLTMIPNYYLNTNNTGRIYYYKNGKKQSYTLNKTNFKKEDEKNAEKLIGKIVQASKSAKKVCVVPTNYKLDTKKAKKKGYQIIKSGLSINKLKKALTVMNAEYFQYLLIIQTPYVDQEEQIDKNKGVDYKMKVTDWEKTDTELFEGWVYGIDSSTFMKYYNICNRVNTLTDNLITDVFEFDTNTKVTDALKAINAYVIEYTAYDNPKEIYDLKWFLEETSESRNLQKKVSHHGVCASYSKLAYAVLGKCGYETLPCAVWESAKTYNSQSGPVHSINQVVIDGKEYYCDFCWASATDPMRYMFLTLEEVNNIDSHYNPVADDYGNVIYFEGVNNDLYGTDDIVTVTFNANGGQPNRLTVKQLKNKKIKKLIEVSRKGYVFDGWYTQKTGGKKVTTSTKIKSNMTLYAHWSEVTVPRVGIKKAKAKKNKKIQVEFKKIAHAKGYQIQYSTSNKFRNDIAKTITIKGNKTFKTTLKELKRKTYYIRVRAYKEDSTQSKVFGKWSKVKRVKVK